MDLGCRTLSLILWLSTFGFALAQVAAPTQIKTFLITGSPKLITRKPPVHGPQPTSSQKPKIWTAGAGKIRQKFPSKNHQKISENDAFSRNKPFQNLESISAAGAYLLPRQDTKTQGRIRFDLVDFDQDYEMLITGSVVGLEPGMYFMEIHEILNFSLRCGSLGPIFGLGPAENSTKNDSESIQNPTKNAQIIGNLGLIFADAHGTAKIFMKNRSLSLNSNSIVNKALVIVRAFVKKEGQSTTVESTDFAIACGVIRPVRAYKEHANLLARRGPMGAPAIPLYFNSK